MNFRKTIRRGIKTFKDKEMFLYGRISERHRAVAYCILHKCYLESKDIMEKDATRRNANIKKRWNKRRKKNSREESRKTTTREKRTACACRGKSNIRRI